MRRFTEILLICASLQLFTPFKPPESYGINFHQDPEAVIDSDSSDNDFTIKVDSFNLLILPPSSGVQFYKEGIVFLSSSKNEKRMVPEHLSFGALDVYYALPQDSVVGKHMIFSPIASFPYPCEAFTFTSDFTSMYFSKTLKKDKGEKIFKAQYTTDNKKRQGWVAEKTPLPFCRNNFTYTHPALSTDGKIMIFASDQTVSLGGMDLFMTRYIGNQWTDPENLGPLINTDKNEVFPYLDPEGNLYFSSDGLPGYGGYDIFISKFNGKTWDEPINLSKQINSGIDDVAFKVSPLDGKSAFFTTRQEIRKSEMQLYRIISDNLISVSDTARLSNILYSIALSENEFPFRTILASTDTVRIIPSKTTDTIEFIRKDIVISPDTQEKKLAQTSIIETPVAMKDTITDSPRVPLIAVPPPVETPVKELPMPVKETVIQPQVQQKPIESISKTDKLYTPEYKEYSGALLYKVQIKSAIRSLGDFQIAVNGRDYSTSEYFYKKEYRYTVGEFSTLRPAINLQNACRRNGYPKAFVVAFENNTRSLDMSKFRLPPKDLFISGSKALTELKAGADRKIAPEFKDKMEIIVYKVQFLSSVKSKNNYRISIDGKRYDANEYFYRGEYRYTIGEFSSILPAIELQYACRLAGFPDAFVVVFKNNVRQLDREFFIK